MPGICLTIAVAIGLLALLDSGNWPIRGEVIRVAASLVLVGGALCLRRRGARPLLAGAWLGLLAGAGMPVPPAQVGADFETFYRGAQALFGAGSSPYTAAGATAFPFPTFPLVHVLSLAGRLSITQAHLVFAAVSVGLLGLAFWLLLRLLERPAAGSRAEPARLLLQAGLMVQPPVLAGLAWGNSGPLAGAAVAAGLWWWLHDGTRASCHAAAAAMVKPQLLMAALFFLACAARESLRPPERRSRAAAIGRLILPWGAALLLASLPVLAPASLAAYQDFFEVARRWHAEVAATHANNLALATLLAELAGRAWGIPVATGAPRIAALLGLLVLAANLRSLRRREADALPAFLPWLLSSLLWTSLVWDWYLTLVLAAPLAMVGLPPSAAPPRPREAVTLVAGIACCTTASVTFFPAGLLLLYAHSHRLSRRAKAPAGTEGANGRADARGDPGGVIGAEEELRRAAGTEGARYR